MRCGHTIHTLCNGRLAYAGSRVRLRVIRRRQLNQGLLPELVNIEASVAWARRYATRNGNYPTLHSQMARRALDV